MTRPIFFLFVCIGCLYSCQPNYGVEKFTGLLKNGLSLELNPYELSPLAARLEFEASQELALSLTIPGLHPVHQTFEKLNGEQQIPILGLYPGQVNPVYLQFTGKDGLQVRDTLEIATDTLPVFMPDISVEQLDTTHMESGFHLCDIHFAKGGKFHSCPIIFDNQGVIRWYLDLGFLDVMAAPMQRISNGHWAFGARNRLYEYDMLGKELNDWKIGKNFAHHDLFELPNGHWVIPTKRPDAWIFNGEEEVASHNDYLHEFDPQAGEIVHSWDLRQILDVRRYDLVDGSNGHWLHVNAVIYSPEDETLIVSARNQGLFKLNWQNQIEWIMAPHRNWGKAGPKSEGPETAPLLLTAVDQDGNPYPDSVQLGEAEHPDFDWPWGQHAPLLLPNGDIFLFDNGTSRRFIDQPNFSRAVQYRVDEANATVQQIWQYGKERGTELFSLIISDVDMLPETGNCLITFGHCLHEGEHYGKIIELNYPEKEVQFEAKLSYQDLEGTGQFGWGQFDILYRAERLSLYP